MGVEESGDLASRADRRCCGYRSAGRQFGAAGLTFPHPHSHLCCGLRTRLRIFTCSDACSGSIRLAIGLPARMQLSWRLIMAKHLSGTEHHLAAATHHEHAAAHHRLASQHYAEKDYAHAAHQALIAHGHGQQAARHANEATKFHIEHHDKPPAPIRVAKIESVQ
jgi:hypothetical protein